MFSKLFIVLTAVVVAVSAQDVQFGQLQGIGPFLSPSLSGSATESSAAGGPTATITSIIVPILPFPDPFFSSSIGVASGSSAAGGPTASITISTASSPTNQASSSSSSTSASSTSASSTSASSASASSTLASSTSASSSMSSSTGSPVVSTAQVRDLAISLGIVGTSLALVLFFLLWRFCIRRQHKHTNGNIDPITGSPDYHPVPTAGIGRGVFSAFMRERPMSSGSDPNVPLNDNNAASISDDDLQRPPIALNHHPVSSSNNGPPSPLSPTRALRTPATPNHRLSTPSMTTDSTMYSRIPILDGSSGVSSSSGNRDINEKISTAIPEKHEENVWGSGYPQPLKFIPII